MTKEEMKTLIKSHKNEILLVTTSGIIIVLSVVCIKQHYEIKKLRVITEAQSEALSIARKRIADLVKLCEEKDAHVVTLASDLLRRRIPEGGRLLAEWKAFKNAA